MTGSLLLSAAALLVGMIVLRRIGGPKRRGAITAADLAVVLSSAEIVQLVYTTTSVQTGLQISQSAILPAVCLIGICLVVAGSFLPLIATVVTALGVVAALTDTWLKEGPEIAVTLVVTVALLWLINRLVRMLLPW